MAAPVSLPAVAIRHNLAVLTASGQVTELRILDVPRVGTVSGYFNDPDLLAAAAARYDGKANIYITLNPPAPALLARANNRLVERPKVTTSDSDIVRRVWLPLDFDPVRPSGISSTAAEHDAALARAGGVRDWLAGLGWPDPVMCDSGNGAHLLYRVDLPNDDASRELVRRCLQAVALFHGDRAVGVDLTTYNAARIWKLPGTLAVKGDPTPDRPHRRSAILESPQSLQIVPVELLKSLADMVPHLPAPDPSRNGHEAFDLAKWIARHNLPVVSHGAWEGGLKWVLNPCPWNPGHNNRSAYIVQLSNGAIAAGCHHNGCAGKGWSDLRRLYEPNHQDTHDGAVTNPSTATNATAAATAAPTPRTLAEVIATFQRWLHMPDPAPLELALAAVVANKAPGDPVWLLLVGVPGSGKTEIVTALTADPAVRLVGTITEGSLLSGVSKRDTAKGARGGLLREIGDFGILAPKDFTTVLSMNRDSRSQVLAALREIYDGAWVRWVGTDGGRKLEWRGKVGLVGGCTNAIDGAHAVMGTLGERFVFCRIPPEGRHAVANRALGHAGQEVAMRSELAAAVGGLLAHTTPQGTADLAAGETKRLVALADLATVCRAPVVRDSYRREIEDVPGAEMPTRVAIVFKLLFGALLALGTDRARIWTLLERVALDSMPLVRRNALSVLFGRDKADTQEIGNTMKVPTVTARRGLEDLAAYGVVDRIVGGPGLPDRWQLSDWTRTTLRAAGVSEIPASVWSDDGPTTVSEIPADVCADTFSEIPAGMVTDTPSSLSLNTPNTTTDGKTEKVSGAPPSVGSLVWCLNADGTIANPKPWVIRALRKDLDTGECAAVFDETITGWPLERCEVVSPEEADVWTL